MTDISNTFEHELNTRA